MENVFRKIIVFLLMSVLCVVSSIAQNLIIFQQSNEPDDKPPIEIPQRGHRMPQRQIIGYIDWQTGEFSMSIDFGDEIVVYEIWIDGICIISTIDTVNFVEQLSLISVPSTIKISIPNNSYIGNYIPD